jgi:hypothetical protein
LSIIHPSFLEIESESALQHFIYHLKMDIWVNENKTLYNMITDNVVMNTSYANDAILITEYVNINKFYNLYKACLRFMNSRNV